MIDALGCEEKLKQIFSYINIPEKSSLWKVPSFFKALLCVLSTGVQWYWDFIDGHFRTVHCQSLSLTIPGGFLVDILSHCPAERPLTCAGDPAFWHWGLHAPKVFNSVWISLCYAHIRGTRTVNLLPVWPYGLCSFLISFSVNTTIYFGLNCPEDIFPEVKPWLPKVSFCKFYFMSSSWALIFLPQSPLCGVV